MALAPEPGQLPAWMGSPVILALSLAAQVTGEVHLEASAGAEIDTNARRAVSRGEDDPAVVTDGLARALLDADGQLSFGRDHGVVARWVLGAKRFVEERDQDLAVSELRLSTWHRLLPKLSLGTFAQARVSRIRSGLRDYELALGGAQIDAGWDAFTLSARGFFTGFGFPSEPNFNHVGPSLALELEWRPEPRWRLSVGGGHRWRSYSGALVIAEPTGAGEAFTTFCEDPAALSAAGYTCTPAPSREDGEWQAEAALLHSGPVMVELRYLLRAQRSTSALENVDRHRIYLAAAFALPWELSLGFRGAAQLNVGTALSDQQLLAEADEQQTSLLVQLERPLVGELSLVARYGLYANQLLETDARFLRQIFHLGLSFRLVSH